MSTFMANIEGFAKATNATLDEASRAIVLALFSGIIQDTRVDTGRLRGNWQTSVGQPATGDRDRLDPNGTAATTEAVNTIEPGQINYLTNNLPYALVWEQQDGMVARNMQRIQRTVEEARRGRG
jgi:hypothetical protein